MEGNWAKTGLVISLIVAGVFFIGFIAETTGIVGGGGDVGGGPGEMYMMCANPDCKATYTLSRDEFLAQMDPSAMPRMRGLRGMTLKCRKCGERSAYRARKCPKCSEIFIPDYESGDYPDRCPKCEYSAMEERTQR